jgi:transposase
MAMLADRVDGVIGIDTHRDTLTAAAVSAVGGLLGQLVVAADAAGDRRLLDFARVQIPGRRCSAVEGAGSYGAGLTRLLVERGEWVVEADRPKQPARRGGKSGREIRRCVKRAIARQLFKLLQQLDRFDTEVVRVC